MSKAMKDNSQMENEVFEELFRFYESSKEWITNYSDYASKFNTEMVDRKLSFSDLNGMLEDYTVLILTANPIEQNILTRKLYQEFNANNIKSNEKLCEIYADGCVYQFATVRNVKIVHIHPDSPASFTVGGSANAVRSALERFRPKLVVSLGVALGIDPKNQHLGDVLLSSAVIPYDIFNKDTDGVITLRSEDKFYTHEALNAWNVLMRTSDFSLEEQEEKRQSLIDRNLNFKWQFGPMLSGGSVLSNEDKKQALLRAAKKIGEEKIIGGEMEGTGVYFECRKPDIPCIVIKGICDWGAEKNSWSRVINIVNQKQHEENSCRSSEYPTNDLIKDCVQAYAIDHATEALFRLLRFDSSFLDAYSPALKRSVQSVYKWRQKFSQVKQFLGLRKEKLFRIASIYIPLLLLFIILNIYINSKNIEIRGELRQMVYGIEVLIFVLLAGIFAIKEVKELHPIEVHHIWVNFNFDKLDFEKNNAQITINDHRPIFNVVISWWMSSGKISQGNQEIGNLKGNSSINFKALNDFNHKTILQIGYELANGDHYVHLLFKKSVENGLLEDKWTIVYCERIFRVDGSKYSLVGIQNAVIKNVIPKIQEGRHQ